MENLRTDVTVNPGTNEFQDTFTQRDLFVLLVCEAFKPQHLISNSPLELTNVSLQINLISYQGITF